MNKKQKRKICFWIIFAVVIVAAIVALVIYGNRKPKAEQFYQRNTDVMDYSPFITNEERLDNSLLEYGKVLNKYSSKGYQSYTGESIDLVPSQYSSYSYTYKNGEDVTLNLSDGKIVSVLYKGKTYDWSEVPSRFEKLYGPEFVTDFIQYANEKIAGTAFSEDYEYTFNVDLENGDKKTADSTKRFTQQSGVIQKDANAFLTLIETGAFSYTVDIKTAGLYSIEFEYFMPKNRDNSAVLGLSVNGKIPFKEASAMEVKRAYGFFDIGSLDVTDSEIMPQQQELFRWSTYTLDHPDGLYRNPYRIYLNKGSNVITFSFSREPVVVRKISLKAPIASLSYEEYKSANNYSPNAVYNGKAVKVEMEVPESKTNTSLRMMYDKDYASSPESYTKIKYNVFGGDRWSEGGQGATWKFTVPATGWYKLGFRYNTTLTDIVCFREIKIDGKIPFAEMEEYCFPYSDGWIGDALKDENQNPYMFYLEEGEHTITMTSKTGPLRSAVNTIAALMDSISTLVTDIASITGAERNDAGGYTVDKNRDWDLQLYINDIQERMDHYVEAFHQVYDEIKEANGGVLPYYGSSVSVACTLFERFADKEDDGLEKIPISLNEINETLSTLSTSLSEITVMPLEVDYMVLSDADEDYSYARSNAWQDFKVGCVEFFKSWVDDYSLLGTRASEVSGDVEEKEIEVYIARGREYVNMLQNLIAEDFTPKTGIKVNVNMVTAGVEGLVMLRYIAGTAPDVALSISAGAPVEYACRGALQKLNDLDNDGKDDGDKYGFYSLKDEYVQESFTYSTYKDFYYSFPETQSWSAMFYRTDIFGEMELKVPETWDEVYDILPILQENQYEFYYPYAVGNLYPFFFQNDVDIYNRTEENVGGMKSGLDTDNAYNAFVEYCDLYNKYNLTYAANFYMNFKLGSMPIGLADVNFYCQLMYSAPEISGKWAMAPIPGHRLADGSVDRCTGGSISSVIILNHNKGSEQERLDQTLASWEFVKWWLGEEIQADYATEVEATFGVGSRWQTANRKAIHRMVYTDEELEVIDTAWNNFEEKPVVLGGYYTDRYMLTALNQAILQGLNARVALEDAVREINKEMARKQKDFKVYDYVINYSLIDGSHSPANRPSGN